MVATMPPKSPTFLLITISIYFLSISSSTLASNENNAQNYVQSSSWRKAPRPRKRKAKASTFLLARRPFGASTDIHYGIMNMMDNVLTSGLSLKSSEVVGRAQGFYASAAQEGLELLMVMNLVFSKGKYRGSSLSIQGRNAAFDQVREMPIVGGSGLFRFARGYAQAQTRWIDLKTGDATVEYNMYVLHY